MTTRNLPLDPHSQALLDAVIAMSGDLDLRSVLHRITRSACELTGARYGALGVIGKDGSLGDLITHGIDADVHAGIAERALGRGILRLVIDDPRPLRLADLSEHPAVHGFPAGHPPMRSFLGVPVRVRDTVFGNLYLTEKAGGAEFGDLDETLVTALAAAAGHMIESARAYGLSERRRQWLEATAEINEALRPPLDHRTALARICTAVRDVTRARAVSVLSRDEHGPVAAMAAEPVDEERVRAGTLALDDLLPLVLDGVCEHEVEGLYADVVPLRSALAGRAAICVFLDRPMVFSGEDERALWIRFADQAALVLDRVHAVEDRADLAVLTDRERIARDLHDVVIQRLFATGLQLQALGQRTTDPEVGERLTEAVDALDLTIKDIRSSIFELHTHAEGSLRAEVRGVVREYVGGLGFTPVVRMLGPVDTVVPEHVRAHLLPVLREGVSNLARHAMARAAEIELCVDEGEVVLTVRDDGVGIDGTVPESGLRNVRCRAQQLSGSFTVSAREPHGTSFVWRVPLV
ncbi:GAF domain-containing sensor histidine kinase [Nocardioides cheoyonin]|uniref:GAF domain-containing sensor histidine kinase n=1 Tax=Nocardioides cheoyonin TaxID=3156615 RepID=UPI0032B60B1B